MGCPSQCILDENLTFTVQARTTTGAPVDTDAVPTYSVYEDETATAILTGSMTKVGAVTGFYSEQIDCSTANGFERYKSYTIRIAAAIGGVSVAKTYTMLCLGGSDVIAATTGALTTTANFKTYAGITIATDDTLIGTLINRATAQINSYCRRTFVSTTYRETVNGSGQARLILNQYPVISIQMVAIGRNDIMTITNTSSDAYNAYVQISETAMTLVIEGGANAGSNSLTLASYATLTLLAAAISALGVNWATSITSGYESWAASELLPVSGLQCFNQYAYLSIPDEPEYDFRCDLESGIIENIAPFGSGWKNIIVKYTAGYATTPADLEQICIDLIRYYYDARKIDASLQSESLGDYSYTRAMQGIMPQEIKDRLQPYVKRSGFSGII